MKRTKGKIIQRFLSMLIISALVLTDSHVMNVLASEAGQEFMMEIPDTNENESFIEEHSTEEEHSNKTQESIADAGQDLPSTEDSDIEKNIDENQEGQGLEASIEEETSAEEELLLSVSGGDVLPSVSSGDARAPEKFYEDPEPENYGTLVTYDEYSRTYHTGDNNYITVIGNDGTTYIDDDGSLREVDNTLVETPTIGLFSAFSSVNTASTYTNRANDYSVSLPEEMNIEEGKGISIVNGEYQMELYPAEGIFENGIAQENAIRYSNVFENIDYQYTVLGNSIKEDIILLEKTEKNSFSFYIDSYGLTPKLENNILYLLNGEEEIFVLEAPEMEDAAGEISFGVRMTVEANQKDGMHLITVTADPDWLSAPDRAYPVRIDPTAIQVTGSAIRIACAEEGSPNTVIGDNGYPYVGYDDGITSGNLAGYGSKHLNSRSYFAIDYDFGALASEAEIVSAAFQVTQKTRWSKGSSEFGLYEVEEPWEVGSLTWNNQIGYNHYFVDSKSASTVRGEALSYDVTEVISAWINGASPNNGLVMKALVEAPNASSAAAGVKMQCEVFYNNASASYAPKLVISWTGELVDLENMSLDDTTIDIYPVVARNGDKSNNTLGVVAHGLAKAGSTVTYSLVNGSTGETEAATTLKYPDSSEYKGSYPTAIDYNRRLSNWQSEVFSGLVPGQVYYVTAKASFEGETGATVQSDTFLIYEEGAFDVLPRIANHYRVDINTIMADMRMQDALTKEGNRIFIRNPQNTAPYEAGALDDYYKAMIDGLLLGRAEDCEFGFDPINLNTGNYYLEYADAAIPDIGGDFALNRTYNSKGAAYKGSMGYGWSFIYDERLGELADGSVIWLKNDGGILTFTKNGEGYTAPTGQNYDLEEAEDGYTITERGNGKKHIFNAYGLLTGLEDIYGNQTTLSYDMDYKLFQITSPSGKVFGLTLDEQERITAIALPDGTTISYTYDEAGNLVTFTDQAGDTIRYQYDSNHYMTAYIDQNGNYVVRNTYDSEGRVLTQKDAEGNEITLSYQEGSTTATDNNGNTAIYHYDSSYRTTKVEYPDGTTINKTYNSEGHLSTLTDEAGNTTKYSYDSKGNLLTETRADGAVRSYSYNDNNQLIKVTDFNGGVTSYTYNESGLMTAVTDAEGGITTYVYDEANRLTAITDPEGGKTTFQYNGACVTSMTDPEGNTWKYTYDAMNRLLTTTNPLGQTSANTYNKKGWAVKEIDATGAATTYTFDKAGNVTAITDAEGQTSAFTYNKKNEMLSGVDPLGNTLVFTYDKNGNKLTETDAEGQTTSYEYDNRDRLTKVTDPSGHSTVYKYDLKGNIVSIRDRRAKAASAAFDTIKNVVTEETDKNGNKTTYETDILGRVTKVIYPDGSEMTYAYDHLSRITSITDQAGLVTQLSYDKNGNLIQIKDDESRIYSYRYNRNNQLVKTTDPMGNEVSYAYDGAGNLISQTDANGAATSYRYDAAQRLTEIVDALGGKTLYSYDKEGRLLSATAPAGDKTVYTYDAIGQLVAVTDALGQKTTYEYDAISRLTVVTNALDGVTAYEYNKTGSLTAMTDPLGNSHSYTVNAEGSLITDTYPNKERESYTYDNKGNVLTYTDRAGVVTTLTYDSMDRVIRAEDTAGNRMEYTYDNAGRLLSQSDVLGRSASYAYDSFGRVVSVTGIDSVTTAYEYDSLDRLVKVTDGEGKITEYSYDPNGNLIHTTEPGEAAYQYTYDALNRLTGKVDPEGAATAFLYDANSNLTELTDGNGVTTTYGYDALNRLKTYIDGNGGSTGYSYDALSRLTAITTPEGIQEKYSYDSVGNITSVTDGMGEVTSYLYDNLYRLTEKTSPLGAKDTYTYDSHDIVTSVTDALGAVTKYAVNQNGKVEAITQPNGGVYSYSYDEVHRLTGITTPLGLESTFAYSIGNDILTEKDNLGRITTFDYDIMHRLVRVTDPEGGITEYGYDARGNQNAVTNALGYTYRFSYDKVDRMTTVTDPEEKAASLVYDMVGNVTEITTPGNRTTAYQYDNNYNTTGITDPMGYLYSYSFDQDNRLTGTKDPLGQTTGRTYDNNNRLTAYVDKMNLTESYTYDSHGNVTSVTATDGLVTQYSYDRKNRITSVTDPMGSVAYYSYDVMDNLTAVTNYAGLGTTYTYDIEGNLTGITDAAGRTEAMTYDIAGRITSYTSNGGNTVSYDYNKLNNLVEKSYEDSEGEESAQPVVYAYNALGERVAMNDATGNTEYTYDGLGRLTSVTTYRTQNEDGSYNMKSGDTVAYIYDEADNLAEIIYPDGTKVCYEYDLNDNLTKVTDREGADTTYVYDAINRVTEIHRPNGISTYNTYNGRNQIIELINVCDDCEWTVSSYTYTYDERGFIVGETAMESLAGYAYDDKHNGKHEDGKHDDLYPHGMNHNGKHDKDAEFAYQIVQTDRTFTYDEAGKLLSMTEDEENYGLYTTTFEYDLSGNRTAIIKTDEAGEVAEYRKYKYNESSQVVSAQIYDGKKNTSMDYTYDADGNLISEIGKIGTDKVETTYDYGVENRLAAVYEADELLVAMAYDGDGNRVFQLNYNLHTDDDHKGNNGNGNGNNKDNSGSGNSSNSSSSDSSGSEASDNGSGSEDSGNSSSSNNGNNGNGNSSSNGNNGNGNNGNSGNSSANNGKGGNGKDNGNTNSNKTVDTGDTSEGESDDTGNETEQEGNEGTSTEDSSSDSSTSSSSSTSTGNGNATNAEENNSQNQSGILFPIDSEVSDTEQGLIDLIKTTGKQKNYELIEYINDVNREYAEVLVEQNINGKTDTSYIYGVDRLSLDRFDGSNGYYLYDPRGSVSGITNEDGQLYQSYRYGAYGEITFGAPQYENEYTYNGESYNPNIESQYLRARYYYVVTASFLTEDSYLGDITEPLTLNRYLYCVASPLNYTDPSGHMPVWVLNALSAVYNSGLYPEQDMAITTMVLNGNIWTGFHEFAQLNLARYLYNQGYYTELEYSIKKANENGKIVKCGEVDVVATRNGETYLWEIKPISWSGGYNYKKSVEQLDRYKTDTNFLESKEKIEITDIAFWGDIKMRLDSDSLRPGLVYYSFYVEKLTFEGVVVTELSNQQVRTKIENDLAIAVGILAVVLVATVAEDVVTAGAGIVDDIPSILAGAAFARWVLGI